MVDRIQKIIPFKKRKEILTSNEKKLSKTISTVNSQVPSFSNSLSAHLERFVNYLQYTKNSSPKTIENYTLRINRFIKYI